VRRILNAIVTLGYFIAAPALAIVPAPAWAEDYPGTRPVMVMMPYAAGGPGDIVTRITAAGINKYLGGQFIVENLAGAGGTIGTAKIASELPDGHSLLVMHFGHAANTALYPKLHYDAIKDFEPIGIIAESPMAFVARKDFPAKDFREFVSYVKDNKDKLTYGFAGVGSASHLCGLLFFNTIGMTVTGAPYKGTGPALTDLIGGHFDFMCDQTLNVGPSIKAGSIKGYAVTTKERLAVFPDLPTASEAGLPGFEITVWFGIYAPKGTPKPIIEQLSKALQQALQDPEVKSHFAGSGAQTVAPERATPVALQAFLKSEIDKWGTVIKSAGVTAE
jgi:tripartite-type tricarboxylate transporter receptor subunit TctC